MTESEDDLLSRVYHAYCNLPPDKFCSWLRGFCYGGVPKDIHRELAQYKRDALEALDNERRGKK